MFTGIVEEIGFVKSFIKNSNGAKLVVCCHKILDGIKIGDSVAVNGVCTTVCEFNSDSFSVDLSDETLKVSVLANLKLNESLNLERALTLASRMGGHIVSGHIDCRGELINVKKLSDFYNLTFEIDKNYMKYVVYKGSITINGISLTVAKAGDNSFEVALIPHTYENTNLKKLKIGDFVNVETDMLGRYVEKLLSAKDNVESKNHISMDFLKENGFV